MPITVDSDIRVFTQDEFHALSHTVLGAAFEAQNEFGRLYREAKVHFLGGETHVLKKVDVFDGGTKIGVNEVCLLSDDTILALTAVTKSRSTMRSHLQRFLRHTKMAFMQWINLNHHDIEFVTLTQERNGRMMEAER